jgi:hypothetical protein
LDRVELSSAIVDELGQLFVETLRRNAARLLESDLDGIEQRVQEMARAVFGPVVEQTVAAIGAAQRDERPDCPQCQRPMRPVDYERTRELQGLVGDYTLKRAYFCCERCQRGLAPLDARLGIGPGALSPGLERVACRLGIEDSFEEATDALFETLRIELPDETERRVTERIGQVAEEELQDAIALAQAGKDPLPTLPKDAVEANSSTLLVEVDGTMVHEVDGQWHEAKAGLAALLGPELREDEQTGRTTLAMGSPSYCVGFESAELFWYRVYVEACRRGLGTALVTLVVVLGDGAGWIWHYASAFLAVEVGTWRVKVIEIVDIYHAFEHLEVVANAVFGQGSEAARQWVGPLKRRLEAEGAAPILSGLAALTPPEASGASEELRKALGYFTENAARMDYPRFAALNLPIGSGAVESSCRTVIQEREKGAGMRWTRQGAQAVASLRALYKSGRWKEFWRGHPQRRRPTVLPCSSARPRALASSSKQAA